MSKSGWLLYVGLIGSLVLFVMMPVSWFLAYQQHHEDERRDAASYSTEAGEHLFAGCAGRAESELLNCIAKAQEADREDRERQHDLKAQQDTAEWTAAGSILAGLGLLVTAAGLFYLARTLDETRKATAVAREIGQNQTRAFVHATEARLYVFLPRNKSGLFGNPRFDHSVVVTFANTGATPAIDLDAAAKLWVQDSGRPDQPIDLEFDQSGVADAIVNGTPVELRFKLAHNDFRPPERNLPGGGIADALSKSNELGLFGLGAMNFSNEDATFEPPETEPPSRGGLSGILATFFESKYVKCRGEILYSDMFGVRFRTEFYFEYFGKPTDGGFEMQPVRGGLQMFQRASPGESAKARRKPPGALSPEAMAGALDPSDFTGEPDPDAAHDEAEP
jgi:hypothetical protein